MLHVVALPLPLPLPLTLTLTPTLTLTLTLTLTRPASSSSRQASAREATPAASPMLSDDLWECAGSEGADRGCYEVHGVIDAVCVVCGVCVVWCVYHGTL